MGFSSVLNIKRDTRLKKLVCLKNRASLFNFDYSLQFLGKTVFFPNIVRKLWSGVQSGFLRTFGSEKKNPFSKAWKD